MATYEQIAILQSNSPLLSRLRVAVTKFVTTVILEPDTTPNHAARVAWAVQIENERASQAIADKVLRYALILDATLADEGESASDAKLQQLVDAYVPEIVRLGL